MYEYFEKKSRWCSIKQVCQAVKCEEFSAVRTTGPCSPLCSPVFRGEVGHGYRRLFLRLFFPHVSLSRKSLWLLPSVAVVLHPPLNLSRLLLKGYSSQGEVHSINLKKISYILLVSKTCYLRFKNITTQQKRIVLLNC